VNILGDLMDRTENEQAWDDFEVEITDLPDPSAASDDDSNVLPPRLSRVSLRPRFTQRQRIMQSIATSSIVALALSFILGSYMPVRDVVTLRLNSLIPTPTATLTPGAKLIYVQKTLSWSQVSLDGHILHHLPVVNSDAPLQLTRGRHRFTWQAEPFQPINCTITIPPAVTDTCASNNIARAPSGIYIDVITFLPSLATLPIAQRAALIQTAQGALDTLQSTSAVEPGEHYFSLQPNKLVDTATQSLRATLRFQLDTDTRFNPPCRLKLIGKPCTRRIIQDCSLFCTEPAQSSPPGEKSWDALASIHPFWKYARTDGQTVAQDLPDVLIEHLVSLHITWDAMKWHVTIVPSTAITNAVVTGGLACVLARDKINLNVAYHFAEGDLNKSVDWFFASGHNPAAGCVAMAFLKQDNKVISSAPAASCLYRFGLLLAVNNTAHLYWPLMIQADTYEQSLAQQIAALPTSQSLFPHGQVLTV